MWINSCLGIPLEVTIVMEENVRPWGVSNLYFGNKTGNSAENFLHEFHLGGSFTDFPIVLQPHSFTIITVGLLQF